MIQHDGFDRNTREQIRRVARVLARHDHHLAEELEQETALTALDGLPADVRERGPWIYRVTLNRLYSRRVSDSRYRRSQEFDGDRQIEQEDATDPALRLLRAELSDSLVEQLEALPERFREPIRLRVLEGLPPRVVAAELGLPVETVRSQVRRGLKMLREQLGDESRWSELRRALTGLPVLGLRWWKPAAAVAAVGALTLVVTRAPDGPADQTSRSGRVVRATSEATLEHVDRTGASGRTALGPGAEPSTAPPSTETVGAAAAPLEVVVRGVDGELAQGVDIFGQRKGKGPFGHEVLGRTDETGRLFVEDHQDLGWLAARGPVGEISQALFIAQPSVQGHLRANLALETVPVRWVSLLGAPLDRDAVALLSPPAHPPTGIELDSGTGIRSLPHWVPGWRDELEQHGVPWGGPPRRLVVTEGSELRWYGRRWHRKQNVPRSLDLADAFTVRGRVVDLDGRPLANVSLELQANERPRKSRLARRSFTADDGTYRFPGANLARFSLHLPGHRTVELERPVGDELLVEDVMIDVGGAARTVVRISAVDDVASVAAISLEEKRVTTVQRMAAGPAKTIPGRRVGPGLYELPLEAKDLAGILVTGSADVPGTPPQRLRVRPPFGAFESPVVIKNPLPEPAVVSVAVPASVRPARLALIEQRSGLTKVVNLERGAEASAPLELHVPPGSWSVTCLGVDGSTHRRRRRLLASGQRRDVGDITQPMGTLQVDWSALAGADPDEDVTVELREGTEIVLSRTVEWSDLEKNLAEIEVTRGWHTLRARRGATGFIDAAWVPPGGVVRFEPRADRLALSVRLPGRGRRNSLPGALVVLRDAGGQEAFRTQLPDAATETGYIVMVPRSLALPVEVEIDHRGELFRGTTSRERANQQVGVVALPVQGSGAAAR